MTLKLSPTLSRLAATLLLFAGLASSLSAQFPEHQLYVGGLNAGETANHRFSMTSTSAGGHLTLGLYVSVVDSPTRWPQTVANVIPSLKGYGEADEVAWANTMSGSYSDLQIADHGADEITVHPDWVKAVLDEALNPNADIDDFTNEFQPSMVGNWMGASATSLEWSSFLLGNNNDVFDAEVLVRHLMAQQINAGGQYTVTPNGSEIDTLIKFLRERYVEFFINIVAIEIQPLPSGGVTRPIRVSRTSRVAIDLGPDSGVDLLFRWKTGSSQYLYPLYSGQYLTIEVFAHADLDPGSDMSIALPLLGGGWHFIEAFPDVQSGTLTCWVPLGIPFAAGLGGVIENSTLEIVLCAGETDTGERVPTVGFDYHHAPTP